MNILHPPIKCRNCGYLAKPLKDFIVDKFDNTKLVATPVCPKCQNNLI